LLKPYQKRRKSTKDAFIGVITEPLIDEKYAPKKEKVAA
jgi:hypothetical protein